MPLILRATNLALLLVLLAFCLLVSRNEFAWMDQDPLPVDDAQGLKEGISIALLALVLAGQALAWWRAEGRGGKLVPPLLAGIAIAAWYGLFWQI